MASTGILLMESQKIYWEIEGKGTIIRFLVCNGCKPCKTLRKKKK